MLTLKTALKHAQPIPGFVYEQIDFLAVGGGARIDVALRAHGQIKPKCSVCRSPCPGYDHLETRRWCQVPLWNIRCYYHYGPRRVNCPKHGIIVEHMPWSEQRCLPS